MNIALYGGTFDPVHRGHLAVARAAARAFKLAEVHFVLTDLSPLKRENRITPFLHRHAMLALALAGEKKFFPSLLEAPEREFGNAAHKPNYSIDTVLRVKAGMNPRDRLFFIVGMDSFLGITSWRQPEKLLSACEFIVVSRPGYSMADVVTALPHSLRTRAEAARAAGKKPARGTIALPGTTIHLLDRVQHAASSTEVRAAITAGKKLGRYLTPSVAEYIEKTRIYAEHAVAASITSSQKNQETRRGAKVIQFKYSSRR